MQAVVDAQATEVIRLTVVPPGIEGTDQVVPRDHATRALLLAF